MFTTLALFLIFKNPKGFFFISSCALKSRINGSRGESKRLTPKALFYTFAYVARIGTRSR